VNATRTNVPTPASAGALLTKNFSSPVSSLLAHISQYVPADQPAAPCSHTRAALTLQI